MKDKKLLILDFLLKHGTVHYDQIAEATGFSERTVGNYLNRLDADLAPYAVKLVRKRNVGVSLDGPADQKAHLLRSIHGQEGFTSQTAREHYLMIKLLLTNRPYTLSKLAGDLFVSRRTIDNDFKSVKRVFRENHVTVQTSRTGIQVTASESRRRHMLAKLLRGYWGESLSVAKQKDGEVVQQIHLPAYLNHLVNPATTKAVMQSLAEFLKQSDLIFSDYALQSLAIHLIIACERPKKAAPAPVHPAPLLPETKQLLTLVTKHVHRTLDNADAQQINAHIAAILDRQVSDAPAASIEDQAAPVLRQQIAGWLTGISPDTRLLDDLSVHLSGALARISQGMTIPNPYTEEIKRNFPMAFDAAAQLSMAVAKHYHVTFNDDESGFLALHFESFFERQHAADRISTVVVCSSGVGTSRLLAQRLEERFREKLVITRTIGLADLMRQTIPETLIISTVPIQGMRQPVVIVNPLLLQHDIEKVAQQADRLRFGTDGDAFLSLLDPKLVLPNLPQTEQHAAMQAMIRQLTKNGVFEDETLPLKLAEDREKLATTAMRLVAIPHISPEMVQRPAIALGLAPEGIDWSGQKVKVVFFLALNAAAPGDQRRIYQVMNRMIDDRLFCEKLAQSPTPASALKTLSEYVHKGANGFE
ncbi:BglG family transcription antiterminator [Lacticaseibacillus zeae]|uniref:BglG family transcription antiterminator n=1 Tax=Lacticaseibacillus zeae subsp. silagei TaxID=3068307 RepID=A0ABD7ZAS8_LACZE|nr:MULTISPECIES: BglG family transcription antiterminator [Lacticaseibacillus]MDE3314358.1 BglG family transcription antiterminator [Lacticaseibacillus zeae]OFS01365.1 transcription antiterminator BglG [Lactobacillus sp. HMSC068F07]WLV83990.1 BglG family transcription antiterminator [Lacticaseibacillus sp. NCIMB 15475]WLV86746.1 BglG family transcription antiterminator [Lacticaseibacillus sp. NCIMB 15474]